MAFTLFASGSKLRASRLNEVASYAVPLIATKASASTRTSTTTPTDDSELTLTFPANQTYEFDLDLLLSSAANAAGDFLGRIAWTNTATVTMWQAGLVDTLASGVNADLVAASNAADATTPTANIAFGVSTTASAGRMRGTIVTGGSTVVGTLQWSQFSSNVNATSLLAGSKFTARRTA